MNFLNAIDIVFKDRSKMTRPIIQPPYPGWDDAIYFDCIHSWMWNSGRKPGIPTPPLVFGEWEIIDKSDCREG